MTTALKLIALAVTALLVSHCKTAGGTSAVKDLNTTGMDVNTGPATLRSWANKMGMTLDDSGSARIASVQAAQFAKVIGLMTGDVIQTLNGQPVASAADLESVATSYALGAAGGDWDGVWTFQVLRGAKTETLQPIPGYDCNPFVLAECGPLNGI